ncbi:cell wall synthase accessory phosphoprotein MacP [Enterococcus bulliens]
MSKRPLVTRSELRRQQKQARSKQQEKMRVKKSEKLQTTQPVRQMKKKSDESKAGHFYRKPYPKKTEKSTSRTQVNQRSREMNTFLMKAIGIVAVLLVLVILAIIYL